MTDVDRNMVFQRAVDLVVKQGEYVEQWAARLVTIQAGLAGAVGFAVSWRGLPLDRLVCSIVILLAVLAITMTQLSFGMIRRHLAWQSGLVASVKLIEGDAPLLFRDNMLNDAPKTKVVEFYRMAVIVLSACWAVVLVLSVAQLITGA